MIYGWNSGLPDWVVIFSLVGLAAGILYLARDDIPAIFDTCAIGALGVAASLAVEPYTVDRAGLSAAMFLLGGISYGLAVLARRLNPVLFLGQQELERQIKADEDDD